MDQGADGDPLALQLSPYGDPEEPEITITWIDDAGEEQWVTYRIIER